MSAINAESIPEDDILTTIQGFYEHLALNMLSLQPREILNPFLLVTEEADHRVGTLQRLTSDMLLILHLMEEIEDPKALDLTWFGHNEQIYLKEAFRRSLVKAQRIYCHVNHAWNELKEALENNLPHPEWYTVPPQKIYQELTIGEHRKRDEMAWELGEHNLGHVYPFGDFFKEWHLSATKEERARLFEENMLERPERQEKEDRLNREKIEHRNYVMLLRSQTRQDTGEDPEQARLFEETMLDGQDRQENEDHVRRGETDAQVDHQNNLSSLPRNGPTYPRPRIPQDTGEDPEPCRVTATIQFPDLKMAMRQLIDRLCADPYPDLRHIPYRRILTSQKREVIDYLYQYIDDDIKSLQNQIITVERLRRIAKAQSERDDDYYWPDNSGYADIVLDDRVAEYWRSYIGQAGKPLIRFKDHVRGAMMRIPTTLHYFVLWKGHGYRSMNFLRLWTLPGPESRFYNEEESHIFANVLEMVFARAFQSLPRESLQDFFPEINDQPYAGLGLNILSPLYQGFTVHQSVRHRFALRAELSQDPEIQEWPTYRSATGRPRTSSKEKWNWEKFAIKQEDYLQSFMKAFSEQIQSSVTMQVPLSPSDSNASDNFDMRDWCSAMRNDLKGGYGVPRPRIAEPIGSVDAQIGIILNHPLLHAESTEDLLPFGFKESGFNDRNSLIWFYDPRQHNLRIRSEIPEAPAILARHHSQIVKKSNLQVILIDQDIGMNWYGPHCPRHHEVISFDLPLYCGSLKFFVEKTTSNHEIKRIYIQSSFSLCTLWTNRGREVMKITEMFRFLEILTKSQDLRPYYTSTRSSINNILRFYGEELNGAAKMTVDNMHWSLESYLYRRGFRTKADISRLEEIGGTLMRGVMLLMHAIKSDPARRKKNPVKVKPLQKQLNRRSDIFGQDDLHEVKTLLSERTKTYKTTKQIPESARREEAPTDNTHESEPPKNSGEVDTDRLVTATEDDLKGTAAAVNDEVLGTADVQEMEQIESLVAEKQTELLSTDGQEDVAKLEIEDSDLLCDDSLNQIVMDHDEKDLDESLEMTTSEQGTFCSINKKALPLRKVQPKDHSRETARSLLRQGKYYAGRWSKRCLRLRINPPIASIALYLCGRKSKEDWPKQLLVRAHIHPGRCHPQRWAKNCHDDEPGAKLAFSVTSNEGTFFVRTSGHTAPHKANTFMDWVSGDPIEALLLRPRRHINAHPEHIISLGLPCPGIYYTDEKAKLHAPTEPQ